VQDAGRLQGDGVMAETTFEDLARSINLRDLGGIAGAGGRLVRRGVLFRSAALGELSPGERAALAALGLRKIIDLRYNRERVAHPTPFAELGCQDYWTLGRRRDLTAGGIPG
jgi:hypothetical protein